MSELNWYVGVDWGGQSHQVCVLDGDGVVRGERAFAHSGPGLAALAAWIAESVAESPAETVGVAIETPRGPVVESLLAHGLAVRLTNRMRDLLWRYYPAFNRVADDLAAPWAMALWKRVPTPAAARGVRLSSYDKLLKKHRIRRFDAAALKSRLAQRPLDVDPASARAAETHMRLLARRLAVVAEQTAEADGRIDAILVRLGSADPAPAADGDARPGQNEEQRDATILRSIPGVGTVVLATLFAEADDVLRRRDYHALRCLCGTAAVTKQSGGYRIVTRRLAVHNLLRDVVYHWANTAMQNDPVSEAKYRALRGRGHGHHRALRTVADRLLYVACAMLRNGTLFDPRHARA